MLINRFPDKEQFCRSAAQHNVIPVCAEILADTETPVSLLRKIYQDKGPVFLLESVEGGERWGRYSFLSGSARAQIRVFSEFVEIEENGGTRQVAHGGDPLAVLRELMKKYNPATVPGLPRFWGGLVGYMAYEMVSFFERIPNLLPKDKPIAHFMIPDSLIIFDNIRNTMTGVIIAFPEGEADAETAYLQASARLELLLSQVSACMTETDISKNGHDFTLKTSVEEETFREMVRTTKAYIRSGDIIQSVISQPFYCDTPPDLWTLYRAQRFINPSPYLYFLHLGGTALVGSSPETMVRMENRIASLRPIAGTRPRGRSEQEDRALADELLQDEKERAEHLMLVDLGRNDLGRVAETGTVQVTDLMVVERYSHVMHLVSNICCDVKPEYDAWDLLRATFPAGTLSGAPKVRAMEIIAEMEKGPRGPYGGAVGYVSFSGNMDLAITIRTACVEDGKLTVRAGAGIVADSDPETERMETVNKAKAIQRALQLVQGNIS
ncbi:anthranilate synthase component I [Desulfonema ishimotonii]|uniref:Anthranilate synthase component 1 n=1 Tax=Desulfonema ishimotonii TaxID=45657 RepID=A0A401FU80_9BACT|nr:anthranilate synthase component I family protein [Desulfonema ishimotonii]GBC60526.1 anthranilate synthase component I [Desulfonema ishimotonii]